MFHRLRLLSLLSLLVVLLVGTGACAHVPEARGPDGAVVWGHIRATFRDSSGPVLVRNAGIQLLVRAERVDEKGKKDDKRFTLLTDRRGYFYQDGLAPGIYRLEMVRTVDWSAAPPPKTPDMIFWLWSRQWQVGLGSLQLATDDGGEAPWTVFELGPAEQRYLGHLELNVQSWALEPGDGCARFAPATESPETYNSLTSARLCARDRADEAHAWLETRRK